MNPEKISVPAVQTATGEDKSISSAARAENPLPQSLCRLVAEQPFFKGLDARQLQLLADSAMMLEFDAGQSIFTEGAPANRFYIILEGKVVLESEVAQRGTVPIQTLGPGEDLGWSWLFPPYYFHLSARALAPTRTLFFYGTRVRD